MKNIEKKHNELGNFRIRRIKNVKKPVPQIFDTRLEKCTRSFFILPISQSTGWQSNKFLLFVSLVCVIFMKRSIFQPIGLNRTKEKELRQSIDNKTNPWITNNSHLVSERNTLTHNQNDYDILCTESGEDEKNKHPVHRSKLDVVSDFDSLQ